MSFIIFCLSFLLLVSCERVIDVDLNSAAPKHVIEGKITDEQRQYQVRITRTRDFDEDNVFEAVEDARVILSDEQGREENLINSGAGIYETVEMTGTPGRTYHLKATIDEQDFTASSTMPEPVFLDSLYVERFTGFGEAVLIPIVSYTDPPGTRNFYRHELYVNDARVLARYISTDKGIDGEKVERTLPFFSMDEDMRIEAGDTVVVEMQSITEPVYDYLFSLEQTINQSVATPANPVSNLNGGALGYFSAHTVQQKVLVVE